MLKRYTELTEEVNRLEGLVEKRGRELEIMNNNRMGMYDDEYNNGAAEGIVTQRTVDDEEEQVKALEEKIKGMQQQVYTNDTSLSMRRWANR
jgi:DASH complex subunit Spc34